MEAKMLGSRIIALFVLLSAGFFSDRVTGAALEEPIPETPTKTEVTIEDVKEYILPIFYQKFLRQPGDSEALQQAKIFVSEYLVDSLLESAQAEGPIRSENFGRQAPATNGTGTGVAQNPIISLIPGTNMTGPSQAHVISQVDRIIQNVNVGNITGIVDQALRIRAPAPVQQLVNGIMNLVLCNPFNRVWNRCYGGGSLFDGKRR